MMRLRILAVAALLAASLAACGGTDTGGTDQDTVPGTAPTEVVPGGDTGTDGAGTGTDTGTDGAAPGLEATPSQ